MNTCSQQFLQGIITRTLYYCDCAVQNSHKRKKIMLSLYSVFWFWEGMSRLKTDLLCNFSNSWGQWACKYVENMTCTIKVMSQGWTFTQLTNDTVYCCSGSGW